MSVPIDAQLACAKRELALRERVYPRWTEAGKMPREQAAREIAAMRAICETLQELVTAKRPELPL
jgi:hypothetical protein